MDRIEELKQQLADILERADAIVAVSDKEKRQLNLEEQRELDSLLTECDALKAEIARRERLATNKAAMQPAGRRSEPEQPGRGGIDDEDVPEIRTGDVRVGQPRVMYDRGKWGWRNFAEFCRAVRNAGIPGGTVDYRLEVRVAPTNFGQEQVGEEGGFAVPPDFRREIMVLVAGEDRLLGMTDQIPISGNAIMLPSDETTPWGTAGIYAEWEGEGDTLATKKPKLKQINVRAHKLMVFAPITDELSEDSPALAAYLTRKSASAIDYKVNEAIVQGTGAGQPLGILKSPSLISIAKESGQVADTLEFKNIIKMWARCLGQSRAIWLINQDIQPQLMQLSFPIVTTSGAHLPLYLPGNSVAGTPHGTLLGRPVFPTQACETLGDQGDIILADPTQYVTVTRGAIRTDTSIHFYFDTGHTAFRIIFRMGGQPWWTAAVSPRDGSNTLSPFVTLDERA